MDVMNVDQAKVAEEAGAVAVMALERIPSLIRSQGGIARMVSIGVGDGISCRGGRADVIVFFLRFLSRLDLKTYSLANLLDCGLPASPGKIKPLSLSPLTSSPLPPPQSDPTMIKDIIDTVSLPVMAKVRIGHFVEAQILQAIGVDYIDESEVLTMADDKVSRHRPLLCASSAGDFGGN